MRDPTRHHVHFEVDAENYRRVAMQVVLLTALTLMAPFSAYNIISGNPLLGIGALAVVGVLAACVVILRRGGRPDRLLLLVVVPLIIGFLSLSLHRQAIVAVLWCYPAIIGFYFLLDARWAQRANLLLLLTILPQTWFVFEPLLAARVCATLLAVSGFGVVSIRVVSAQQQRLREVAVTDPLTGLHNRTLLQSTLDFAIGEHQRMALPMSLLALDIDHFKRINDTRGHDAGDIVLQRLAALLHSRMRRVDRIFRLGGEEFLILLHGTDATNARGVAESLRKTIAELTLLPDHPITVSLGVAELLPDDDWRGWIKRADQRLYDAKAGGRNRVVG